MQAKASNGTSDIYEGNPTPTTSRGGMVCGSRDEDEQVQQQREAIVTAPLPATGFATDRPSRKLSEGERLVSCGDADSRRMSKKSSEWLDGCAVDPRRSRACHPHQHNGISCNPLVKQSERASAKRLKPAARAPSAGSAHRRCRCRARSQYSCGSISTR